MYTNTIYLQVLVGSWVTNYKLGNRRCGNQWRANLIAGDYKKGEGRLFLTYEGKEGGGNFFQNFTGESLKDDVDVSLKLAWGIGKGKGLAFLRRQVLCNLPVVVNKWKVYYPRISRTPYDITVILIPKMLFDKWWLLVSHQFGHMTGTCFIDHWQLVFDEIIKNAKIAIVTLRINYIKRLTK